ncbi:hypothetical protein COY07_03760 [Candidatus Peregrinibacteria bacterium CG_4_10_14_0_2_um_filter_43_11]|nr:MAG: hypothetical protein COY07_03760 [Candidatus Peregrinibacteria bacterium CG_4_10_14_0_2_um_filter_43_11]
MLAATLIWGFLFYKKDYHPQPLRIIVQVFVIGLFSMVPVFAYKFIYQHYLPLLSEYEIFRPLLTQPLLIGLGYFLFNLVLLTTLLFTLSSLMTLILTVFKHDTLINIKRALKEESLDFVATSMMIGGLIYVEVFLQSVFNIQIIHTVLGTILFLGIIEEYIKHLIVRLTDDKKLRDIDDAITLSVMVGLAFALIETIVYAISTGDFALIIYRSFLSLPIHLIASGIFGYYYGLAHFAKPIVKTEGGGDKIYHSGWLPKILKCRRSTLYADGKMTEGLFFASLFHAVTNVLFEINLTFLVVPIVVLGLVVLNHLYKMARTEWKAIRA